MMFLNMGLQCLDKIEESSRDKRTDLGILKAETEKTRKMFEIQAILSEKVKENIIENEVELNKDLISNETIEELISEIKHLSVLHTLLSRSAIDHKTLATEFIDILSAYDCKLLLLDCLNHLSIQEIEQAWRNLIRDCTKKDYPDLLVRTMKTIHLNSDHKSKIFPLAFLIENLEKINCEDKFFQGFREHDELIANGQHLNCNCQFESPYWLPELLLRNLSFPFPSLFSAYSAFVENESANHFSNQSFFHSIICILTLASSVFPRNSIKRKKLLSS